MGIVFQNGRFGIDRGPTSVKKSAAEEAVLRQLRSFLDTNEPDLVYLLVNTWRAQGKAITYKEIREAILAGEISAEYFKQWQQDYARFVVKHLQPAWVNAIAVAAQTLENKYPEWFFNPMAKGVWDWVQDRAASFVTNSTNVQREALRAVIQRAALLEDKNVDQLARAIRPMIGLTKQQANANFNYYQSLLSGGVSEKKALDLAARDAARRNRYRAYNIARTELASAYNKGADEGIRQAQEAGYIGVTVKIWCTADDERTCDTCAALEGKAIAMDDEFDGINSSWSTRLTPPAHPGCRCAVIYDEIEPPSQKNE